MFIKNIYAGKRRIYNIEFHMIQSFINSVNKLNNVINKDLYPNNINFSKYDYCILLFMISLYITRRSFNFF